MKSIIAAILIAFAFGTGIAAPASVHAAAAKPWTDADYAELERMGQQMLPLVDSVNTALKLLTTDQPKACAAAKQAQVQVTEAEKAFKALDDRIRAEGKDTEPLARMNEGMKELKAKVPEMVDTICNTDMSQVGDAESQAVLNKAMGFISGYSDAVNEAVKAKAAGDLPRACAKLNEAKVALDGLDGYLAELKVKYKDDAASLAELNNIAAQARDWRGSLDQMRATCPAQ